MKFKTKIWTLPASAATVFIIGCAISYEVGADTAAMLQRLCKQDYPAMEEISRIERHAENFRVALQAAAIEGDDSKLADVEALGATELASIAVLADISGQTERAASLRNDASAYQTTAVALTRAMIAKKDVGNLLLDMQSKMASLDRRIESSKQETAQQVSASQEAVAAGVKRGLLVVLGTCLAALAMLATVSRVVIDSVWRDLGDEPTQLGSSMRRIAKGDLTSDIGSATRGMHSTSVRAALVGMVNQLRETVGSIRKATDSIADGSREIASGNQDLSVRTEHTSANLQQAASAMEELTSTVGNTDQSAIHARSLSRTTAEAARQGSDIVSQVIVGMNEISAASRKIEDIIGVIDGIAFQTNILALNAAVEAARAGEQGRGFAVVANEVRNLAQRSAHAAKEVKSLIGLSREKVESGTKLVSAAGGTMAEILAGVNRVTDVISEISDATTEQSAGIGNLNQSVAELDQMTQQNAALVEQSAAAAASLSEQARSLTEAVSVFRLQGDEMRSI
jgi:methyl-accepting chemotaxis protein